VPSIFDGATVGLTPTLSEKFWMLVLGASLELGRLVLGTYKSLIPTEITRADEIDLNCFPRIVFAKNG
jgi:hypothetical protein